MGVEMKRFSLFLVILILAGCATANKLENFRLQNRQALPKISIGMTKEAVNTLMGTNTAEEKEFVGLLFGGYKKQIVNNPYRTETLQGKDKVLEVYYYYTDVKSRDDAITDDELTPIVFDEGKVIGWGWSFLETNASKYEIRLR